MAPVLFDVLESQPGVEGHGCLDGLDGEDQVVEVGELHAVSVPFSGDGRLGEEDPLYLVADIDAALDAVTG